MSERQSMSEIWRESLVPIHVSTQSLKLIVNFITHCQVVLQRGKSQTEETINVTQQRVNMLQRHACENGVVIMTIAQRHNFKPFTPS